MTSPPENPHRKRKTFFSMSTRRLAESVKGLNSSLALAAGDLWPKKGRPNTVVKGLNPFKSRARQNFGASLQCCNLPPNWARELSKPSSHSASPLLEIKKKDFCSWFGVHWGDCCKWGCFCFFWPPLPGPGPQPIGPLFWLKIFWKLGQNPRV